MELITNKQEYELIMNQDVNPIINIGISGKPSTKLHDGHIFLAEEARRLKPNHILICRINKDQPFLFEKAQLRQPIFDPDTGVKMQNVGPIKALYKEIYTLADMYAWIETNTSIDYVSISGKTQCSQWYDDSYKVAVAMHLNTYNLDFDNLHKPWADLIEQANSIIEEDEIHLIRKPIDINLLRLQLLAQLMRVPNYNVRLTTTKDAYSTACKQYIYNKYSDMEFLVIEAPINSETGMPRFSGVAGVFDTNEKKKIKADMRKWNNKEIDPTFSISLKWLDGKTYEELVYILPNGNQIPRGRII